MKHTQSSEGVFSLNFIMLPNWINFNGDGKSTFTTPIPISSLPQSIPINLFKYIKKKNSHNWKAVLFLFLVLDSCGKDALAEIFFPQNKYMIKETRENLQFTQFAEVRSKGKGDVIIWRILINLQCNFFIYMRNQLTPAQIVIDSSELWYKWLSYIFS